jgi:hypothetical protein
MFKKGGKKKKKCQKKKVFKKTAKKQEKKLKAKRNKRNNNFFKIRKKKSWRRQQTFITMRAHGNGNKPLLPLLVCKGWTARDSPLVVPPRVALFFVSLFPFCSCRPLP